MNAKDKKDGSCKMADSPATDKHECENKKVLTNEVGAPVHDNTNSVTAGRRGPLLMEDVWLMEKLAHFDREVIPERRMHAKGSGAYGCCLYEYWQSNEKSFV